MAGYWDTGTLTIGKNFFFEDPWTSAGGSYDVNSFHAIDNRIFVVTSKSAWKRDIEDIQEDVVDRAFKLRPVTFMPMQGPDLEHAELMDAPTFGLIAEEVHETVPEAALLDKNGEPGGINKMVVTALTLAMCQRLMKRVEALEAEVTELRSLVNKE